MEVTSTSRSNNRLLQSASSTFSVAADNQVNNFELLLDLPTAFECCPVEVDENLPPESAQAEPNSPTVTSSEDNSLKDSSQADHDENDDRLAESVASELAVIQAPLPIHDDNVDTNDDDLSTNNLKITSDSPVASAKKTDTTSVDVSVQTNNSSQQVQFKQVQIGNDEAASSDQTLTEGESALPKADVQIVDSQQAGLNRDANKKALKVESKNGSAEEPTQQTDTPIRLTEKSESSENGSQESFDHTNNEQAQPVAVEQDRSRDSGDRPARWYEQDSSQQSGESNAKEIANANADSQDGKPVSVASEITTSANESLTTSGTAEVSQADTLASDIPTGLIQSADATLATSTSASTFTAGSAAAASEIGALDSIDSESTTSGVRPGFSTEQKLANKTSGIPGNNLESSQTGQQVDISRAEKVRLAQRVARSFSRVGPTGGNVQLKLHPPELGSLAVNIKIEGKSMSAKLTTESQAAREVIMESLPQLRTRLAEQGYDVVQLTVDVASESATTDNQSGTGQGTGQGGAGQGGQSGGSYESSSRSLPGTDLRRSNYLRRQIDASQVARPTVAGFSSRSIDIQA